MLKRIALWSLLVGLFSVSVIASEAQIKNKTPRGGRRMDVQKTRIKRGVRNGSLTAKETARLRNQRRQIKTETKIAKSDGKMTVSERRSVRRDLNKSSKSIYKAKHNNRTRQ